MAAMTHSDDAIVQEIHAVMHLYPSKANDDAFIVTTVAEAMTRDPKDVRKVWDARFKLWGAC